MTEEQPYIYVVGEVGEWTPVKIGVTAKPRRRRLAAYQTANWREVEYLLCRRVPIERMLVDEFLVHRTLSPWWKKGEWFDVRDVADQIGGWEQLVEAAIAGEVPGGERFDLVSADGDHRLVGMKRVARTFEISCSCGHTDLHDGRLPKAVEQFAATHLGISWQRPFFEPRRVARRAERNARNRR
ncbi:MAG TPA: GIY-YIG nuclease family protein [Microthrixaceae bacterium]|nr:GIY-YIG nuclease family protein [Microthrixaceae bacterium]